MSPPLLCSLASRAAGIVVALVVTSCGGIAPLSPTAPSIPTSNPADVIVGTVGPLRQGTTPCFAERYPCTAYEFTLAREGPIDLTLTWNDAPRALFVQLYWAGEGLAHEDVAPRSGPSRISFTRPHMEASRYQVRVVSLEPEREIPFTLTLNY